MESLKYLALSLLQVYIVMVAAWKAVGVSEKATSKE